MENWHKTILSLYDHSGVFANQYRKAGYNVVQVDLLFNNKDVRLLNKLNAEVYGIIAMPPCTKFSKAGSWVIRSDAEMLEALSMVDCVFRFIYLYNPVFWVIENPPGKLTTYLGQPLRRVRYQDCGADLRKDACLWGKFNFPYLAKKPGKKRVEDFSGSSKAGKILRSKTPVEFAKIFFEHNH